VRRKRSSFRRLRPFWIVGIVIAGLATWGGVALANMPAFQLKSLDVTGLARVTRSDVLAHAQIDRRANVWLLDTTAIEQRIDAIPYVETARVHRRPVANVWIEIVERTPSACVRDGAGHEFTIDDASRVLETDCRSGGLTRFTLQAALAVRPGAYATDRELAALRSDEHTLGPAAANFEAFSHDRFGGLCATLRDGIQVEFGDDTDLDQKQRLIDPILAELGPRALDVAAVDLRAETTPVVDFRPPAPVHPHPVYKL
jgi:cell division septal protein FtsQ